MSNFQIIDIARYPDCEAPVGSTHILLMEVATLSGRCVKVDYTPTAADSGGYLLGNKRS